MAEKGNDNTRIKEIFRFQNVPTNPNLVYKKSYKKYNIGIMNKVQRHINLNLLLIIY